MQARVATKAQAGQPCRLCNRTVKHRQAILVDTVAEIRFGTGRTRLFHLTCMRNLVDDAPAGVDEMDQVRDQILASGNAYA